MATGCGGGRYCPQDLVTREQMAAFMNRLGALSPGKTPVVNADKVDGKHASQFMPAGDLVMVETGVWTYVGPEVPIHTWEEGTRIVSPGAAVRTVALNLDTPSSIGGRSYGLKSVEVCFQTSEGQTSTITHTTVDMLTPAGQTIVVDSGTDHPMSSTGCITLTDPTPSAATGGARVSVSITFSGPGAAKLTVVNTTWTPVA